MVFQLIGLALVGHIVYTELRHKNRVRENWATFKTYLRKRHFVMVPITLAGVIAISVVLHRIPGLDWGWSRLLGGQGSAILGVTDETMANSDQVTPTITATTTVLERLGDYFIPLLFMTVLIPFIPSLATLEEEVFRKNLEKNTFKKWVFATLGFGLVHMVMGINIAAAIAIGFAGFMFSLEYLHGRKLFGKLVKTLLKKDDLSIGEVELAKEYGVRSAGAFHALYNLTIIGFICFVILVNVFYGY